MFYVLYHMPIGLTGEKCKMRLKSGYLPHKVSLLLRVSLLCIGVVLGPSYTSLPCEVLHSEFISENLGCRTFEIYS